jgi:hypothetical protein
MTPLLARSRPGSAMAEEFENYEARLAEAHRAVERWETDGGAQDTEQPEAKAPDTVPDDERTIQPDACGASS